MHRAHAVHIPGLVYCGVMSPAEGQQSMYIFFFFFQAEDGIRDLTVTGVQTCALPIFRTRWRLYFRTGWTARFWSYRARAAPPSRPTATGASTNRHCAILDWVQKSWQIGRASCRERV